MIAQKKIMARVRGQSSYRRCEPLLADPCFHCGACGKCACAVCAMGLPAGTPARCVACAGSGRLCWRDAARGPALTEIAHV